MPRGAGVGVPGCEAVRRDMQGLEEAAWPWRGLSGDDLRTAHRIPVYRYAAHMLAQMNREPKEVRGVRGDIQPVHIRAGYRTAQTWAVAAHQALKQCKGPGCGRVGVQCVKRCRIWRRITRMDHDNSSTRLRSTVSERVATAPWVTGTGSSLLGSSGCLLLSRTANTVPRQQIQY